MEGLVTEVHQADQQDRAKGLLGAVSVEGTDQGGTQVGQASVAVTDKTLLFELEGQSRRPITFEALKTGQRVQIRFLGPVAETYPVQATADEIVVMK
jgi:hypothetical protein